MLMKLDTNVRLRSSWFAGEGELKISPEWDEIYPLWRADVLKDWIYELTHLYSEAMMEMGRPHKTSIEFVKVEDDYSE
jgi:hypothetical protein